MSRILLSAYACEPDQGSEPAVGWLWATQLAAAGHDVTVITRKANRQAIEGDHTHRGLPLRFVYCDLPSLALLWKRKGRGARLYYWLWQWIAFLCARRLLRVDGPFDFVQHVTFVSLRAPSLMGLLGIPFVFGPVSGGERIPEHLLSGLSWRARLGEYAREAGNLAVRFGPLMRLGFRKAERILLTSTDSLRLVPRRFHWKCRVQFGVHIAREYLAWTGRRPLQRCPTFRLLYAGRLLEWKGLGLVMPALKALRDRGVPAELTLIGDGPMRPRLQSQATRLGLDSHVRWCNWLQHSQLQREYHVHDVFFYPSLRDSGGMAVLEALAHGLPAVCCDLGGPAFIVNHSCGRVISTRDRNWNAMSLAFAEALQEIWSSATLQERLSQGARRRAWEFEFERCLPKLYSESAATQNEMEEQTAS